MHICASGSMGEPKTVLAFNVKVTVVESVKWAPSFIATGGMSAEQYWMANPKTRKTIKNPKAETRLSFKCKTIRAPPGFSNWVFGLHRIYSNRSRPRTWKIRSGYARTSQCCSKQTRDSDEGGKAQVCFSGVGLQNLFFCANFSVDDISLAEALILPSSLESWVSTSTNFGTSLAD